MQKNLLFVVLSLFIFSVTDCNREKVDVTYTKDIKSIVVSHCANCHFWPNSNQPPQDPTYEGTKVLFQRPNFLDRIEHKKNAGNMPRSYKLPNKEIKKIRYWIEAGYPQ